jgi:hypothetical protein
MSRSIPVYAAAVVLLSACGARGEPAPGAVPEVEQPPPSAPDSLVLTLAGGATVWLAEGRRAADSAGAECFERSVEIRRDSVRLKVPLLFTGANPTRVSDSVFRAELFHKCRTESAYLINIRDGMPHKIKP